MRIAYPIDLFDRNITDGRMMLVSFLTLVIGNNQGMGDIEHAKMYDFYMPRARDPAVRRPGQGHLRPVAHPRPPGQGRRLHRRHHHQAQARPAPRALRQGRLPVLARRRLHQERRAAGQPGVLPGEEGLSAGLRRDEARHGRDRPGQDLLRQHHRRRPLRNAGARRLHPRNLRPGCRQGGLPGRRLCRRPRHGHHRAAPVPEPVPALPPRRPRRRDLALPPSAATPPTCWPR
jgi:hypothetical protein